MYGIVTGISDTDSIKYCPVCGEEVSTFHADGTATCNECGCRFGIVICEE